jgi:hypothetical protein
MSYSDKPAIIRRLLYGYFQDFRHWRSWFHLFKYIENSFKG